MLNPVRHRPLINLFFSENNQITLDSTFRSKELDKGSSNQKNSMKIELFVHKIHQYKTDRKNMQDRCEGLSAALNTKNSLLIDSMSIQAVKYNPL